ncbi:MAG: putative secreted protein, partial [Verrucomicrobiales bacterium]|nr:putative secreted protein [Verrucomicrobiales bacterium]
MTAGLNFVLRGGFTVMLLCAGPLSPARAASLVSPSRGLYDRPIEVVMQTDVPESTIYFTTNGKPVTIESGISNKTIIEISTSTILHAAVYKNGKQIGAAQTHTYLFPKAVAEQRGGGFPTNWGMNNGKPVQADYEMDPEIALAPRYKEDLLKGLRAIPTVSLVLNTDDLFETARGIYAN